MLMLMWWRMRTSRIGRVDGDAVEDQVEIRMYEGEDKVVDGVRGKEQTVYHHICRGR